jgi:protein gp37
MTPKGARWTGEVRMNKHLADPLRWRDPSTVFANSMSDLFHESLTNEQIAAVFGVMAACPKHTFQVLTKRAKRMREWFAWLDDEIEEEATADAGADCSVSIHEARAQERSFTLADAAAHEIGDGSHEDQQRWYDRLIAAHAAGWAPIGEDAGTACAMPWPLPNCWLGVSTEHQAAVDERIPELLRTPAAVRFISAEPLIDDLYLTPYLAGIATRGTIAANGSLHERPHPPLDWVIAGCESGPGARDCDPAWLRSLRDQCAATCVAYFLKQARPWDEGRDHVVAMGIGFGPGSKRKAGGVIELPYLDGKQWAQFPEVSR